MTSTLHDMIILTNILINGTLVTSSGGLIDRDLLCEFLLGWVPPTIAYRGDYIQVDMVRC
jgi:hypothetical protein